MPDCVDGRNVKLLWGQCHSYHGPAQDKLRAAGKLLKQVLAELVRAAVPGNTTLGIDLLGARLIKEAGAQPLFTNYDNFPGTVCLSNNSCIVHGFPNKEELKVGDVLSIDTGLKLNGFCSDACRTVVIGKPRESWDEIVLVTERAYRAGLAAAKLGGSVGDIGFAVHSEVLKVYNSAGKPWTGYKYKIYSNFQGHGIGLSLHEDPAIMNTGFPKKGAPLLEGMCFTIEPVVLHASSDVIKTTNAGCLQFHTSDLKPTAHYENTLLLTEGGLEVLTE